ncbi:MAG: agmatinase [Chloroflexi bacterium]|nr:agmatinase [Chloroflexota bacterium]
MTPLPFYPPRNFAGLSPEWTHRETARVLILPVPYDSTTEYRGGSKEGPQATIDASQYMELYDAELDEETYRVGIHTLPEVEPAMQGPEAMMRRLEAVARDLLKEEKLLVTLGGEHSITIGLVRACKERFPRLSVLALDAHADLRQEYLGSPFSHACVTQRLVEMCPVTLVGVRSLSREEKEFMAHDKLNTFFATTPPLTKATVENIVDSLSPQVYVTIDLDVLDPSIMAAVSNPEPGGLNWHDTLDILRGVARRRQVVGFDLMELVPREGPVACAFLAAKLAYKFIGYISFSKSTP